MGMKVQSQLPSKREDELAAQKPQRGQQSAQDESDQLFPALAVLCCYVGPQKVCQNPLDHRKLCANS